MRSTISPKLVCTYQHIVEDRGITLAPLFLRLISSLTKILIDWGGLFHDINLKNNGAIVILCFLLHVVKFARILVTNVKNVPICFYSFGS